MVRGSGWGLSEGRVGAGQRVGEGWGWTDGRDGAARQGQPGTGR